MSIHISENAINELRKLEVGSANFLRVSVIPGGCSGMTYSAGIDDQLADEDEVVYEQDDLRVVADAGSATFLDSLEIDYSYDLIKSGFRFRNPNAKKACGCGSSFAT